MKDRISLLILSYLRFWARVKVARLHPWIVGVTGSVGKSSFLSLLSAVCGSVYATKTTSKGNSESGLPLEILGLRENLTDYTWTTWLGIILRAPFAALTSGGWNFLIAEMGVDSPTPPKNMEYLLTIVRPDVGVILNVSTVHAQQFAGIFSKGAEINEQKLLDAIAKEKGKLVTALSPKGTAIINIDQKEIKGLTPQIHSSLLSFGMSKDASVRLVSHKADLREGTRFTFFVGNKEYELNIPHEVLFQEYGMIIAAVIATAIVVHIPPERSIEIITQSFRLPAGRFSVLSGKKGSTLLDSSYNSSPEALSAALTFLSGQKSGKRIAVLGDMRELGPLAESKHRQAMRLAATSADIIILVGPLMKQYVVSELHALKFPRDKHFWFLTSRGVGGFVVKKFLGPGDTVLIKGSQNTIFLEETVAEMHANPKDKTKLCRQSLYWDGVREAFFAKNAKNLI